MYLFETQMIVGLFKLGLHLISALWEGNVPCEWSLSFQEPKHVRFPPILIRLPETYHIFGILSTDIRKVILFSSVI